MKNCANESQSCFFNSQPRTESQTKEIKEDRSFIQSYKRQAEDRMIEQCLKNVLSSLRCDTSENEEAYVRMVHSFIMGHDKGAKIDSISQAILSDLKNKFGSDRLIACLSTDFVHGLESTVSPNYVSGI